MKRSYGPSSGRVQTAVSRLGPVQDGVEGIRGLRAGWPDREGIPHASERQILRLKEAKILSSRALHDKQHELDEWLSIWGVLGNPDRENSRRQLSSRDVEPLRLGLKAAFALG